MKKLLSVFVLFALVACEHAFQKEVDEINATIAVLEECKAGVDAIDMDALRDINAAVGIERDFMNHNNRDTLARDEAVFLANYFRYIKKRMARILKGQDKMLKNIETTKQQLSDLQAQIKNEGMPEAEWRAYLSTEMTHVQRDTTLGFEMVRDAAAVTERYNNEHETVVKYVKAHRESAKKRNEQAS